MVPKLSHSAPPPVPAPPKRRRWAVSLRVLLVAVLLINVAIAAWYRWIWTVHLKNTDALRVDRLDDDLRIGQELSAHAVPKLTYEREYPTLILSDWAWKRVQTRYHAQNGREEHGLTQLYFSDNTLHGVEEYQAGRLHGRYELYYPGGKLLTTGRFDRGRTSGVWEIRRPDGGVILRAEYEPPGVPRRMELSYRPGDAGKHFPAPIWITASDAGELEVDVVWKFVGGDLRRSEEVRRDPTGERRIVRHFLNGARHGRQENRDERNRLRFEADWNTDRPDGRWACYGPDGDRRLSAEFREGKLIAVNGKELSPGTQFRNHRIFRVGTGNYQVLDDRPIVLKDQPRTWRDVFAACENVKLQDEEPPADELLDETFEWEWEGPDRAILLMIRELLKAKAAP